MRALLLLMVLFLWVTPGQAAGLLNGATATSHTIPAGWTAVAIQGFEGTIPSTQSLGPAGTLTTAQAHSGTKSVGGTISYDAAAVYWALLQGNHTSREVYLSFWEYMSADGSFNDEMFAALFKWVNPSDANHVQHVYYDWLWTAANCGHIEGMYNAPAGQLVPISEGIGPGELHKTYWAFNYAPCTAPQIGQWAQFEIHFRANTPGLSDGFFKTYINGVQRVNMTNSNHNGGINMTGMRVQAGGTYTRHVWRYPSTTNFQRCGLYIGDGNSVKAPGQPDSWYRCTNFTACSCPPNTNPFERYIDDVIVMVPSGSGGGGGDITPPATPTVTASVISGTSVSLTMSASSDNVGVVGRTVLRCSIPACTPNTTTGTVSGTTNTFLDTTVSPGVSYRYAVRDVDAVGNQSTSTTQEVTTTALFRSTTTTDPFTRADNTDLGASYDAQGACKILSNRVSSTTVNARCYETYTTAPANDQWAQAMVGAYTGAQAADQCVLVRASNAAVTAYAGCVARNGTNTMEIQEYTAGTPAVLDGNSTYTPLPGDQYRLDVQGSTLRLYLIRGSFTALVASTTDATIASGRAGVSLFVATGGSLANSELDNFAYGEFGTASSTIAFDAVSNSAAGNTANTISWSHTTGTGENRILNVCAQSRDTVAADTVVSGITYAGQALTLVRNDLRDDGTNRLRTTIGYLVAPPSGTNTVTITFANSGLQYGVGTATSWSGVDQSSPIDSNNGATGSSTTPAVTVTTVANNAMIVDCVVDQSPNLVAEGSQTTRANRETTGTVDSTGVSAIAKATAGAESMDWTATTGNWAISALSFKPGVTTPVVPPTITATIADATGANLTFGPTTPTTIRVHVSTDDGIHTLGFVEPISAFPAGRYTRTWLDGYGFVCFYPRDSLGVENVAGSSCDDLTDIVAAADTTPATLTSCQPTVDLPAGTTSWTFSCALNKVAEARAAATDLTYENMSDTAESNGIGQLTVSGLVASGTLTGLTDDSTTTRYIRSFFRNTLNVGYSSQTGTAITVHVLAAPGADTTAPTTVTGLVAVALSSSQVELTWTAATDAGGIAGYRIYQDLTGACTSYTLAVNSVATTTIVLNVPPTTTVSYAVRAIDTSNNLSVADSNCATVTTPAISDVTPPTSPTLLRLVSAFTQGATLTWVSGTDLGGPVFSTVEISPAGCSAYIPWPGATKITDTTFTANLSPGTSYCARVFATDLAGNRSADYSNEITFTTATVGLPGPRTNLPEGETRSTADRSAAGARTPR